MPIERETLSRFVSRGMCALRRWRSAAVLACVVGPTERGRDLVEPTAREGLRLRRLVILSGTDSERGPIECFLHVADSECGYIAEPSPERKN